MFTHWISDESALAQANFDESNDRFSDRSDVVRCLRDLLDPTAWIHPRSVHNSVFASRPCWSRQAAAAAAGSPEQAAAAAAAIAMAAEQPRLLRTWRGQHPCGGEPSIRRSAHQWMTNAARATSSWSPCRGGWPRTWAWNRRSRRATMLLPR
jgi:hypothetical protein